MIRKGKLRSALRHLSCPTFILVARPCDLSRYNPASLDKRERIKHIYTERITFAMFDKIPFGMCMFVSVLFEQSLFMFRIYIPQRANIIKSCRYKKNSLKHFFGQIYRCFRLIFNMPFASNRSPNNHIAAYTTLLFSNFLFIYLVIRRTYGKVKCPMCT